jgi:5-methylthioadenosine/S-adenosylhomocysteine deaminase
MNHRLLTKSVLSCIAFFMISLGGYAQTAKLLVKNAYLFTMAKDQREPIKGCLIVAEDGKISQIGQGHPPAIHAKKVINAHGKWIIPGFISAHSHLWQAAYTGLATDKTLKGWMDDLYFRRAVNVPAQDFYWYCLLGALNHLEHGITTVYSFNFSNIFAPNNTIEFDQFQFQAELNSGIRFIHGYLIEMVDSEIPLDKIHQRLESFLAWTKAKPQSPQFLSVMLSGLAAFSNSYQQAAMEASLMNEFKLGNQAHYLEPPETIQEERNKFKWFMDNGLLSKQLIFGHFVHPDDFIIEQTAKAGTSIIWNPLSNGRLASGIADIPKYLKMGIRVGMGVDGEASADLADPFENMRVGLYMLRAKYTDPTVLTPYQMLWLHTMGSADALGIKTIVGSLEPGKFADFLIINPSRFGALLEDPYAKLVLVASEGDIDRVYVAGELKVKQHRLVHQDLGKVQKEVLHRVMAANRMK